VHSEVDDCHLLFPTYARELSDLFFKPEPIITTSMSGSHNTIRNTTLGYTPLGGLEMIGSDNTLENNLVHDVCWNGSLKYPAISMSAVDYPGNKWNPTLIKGNTVYNTGSAGIKFINQAYIVEYNYVHHAGLMSHDVAAIYTGGSEIAGSIVRYNWVHDCHPEIENKKNNGLGIRSDDQSRDISIHHNVVWDVGLDGIVVKGEYNKVYNNTVFNLKPECRFGNSIFIDTEPEPYKAWRMDHALFSEQNAHSLVFNNVVGLIRAQHKTTIPFIQRSNAFHNQLNYVPDLRDPKHFDFRPKKGASLIDGGIAMPGLTDSFEGDAPDVGAYEYGGIWWEPGYKFKSALFYRNNKGYNKLIDTH